MRWALVLIVAACNPVFDISNTQLVPPDEDDGSDDLVDNCPTLANADQLDSDADNLGDACDNCRSSRMAPS